MQRSFRALMHALQWASADLCWGLGMEQDAMHTPFQGLQHVDSFLAAAGHHQQLACTGLHTTTPPISYVWLLPGMHTVIDQYVGSQLACAPWQAPDELCCTWPILIWARGHNAEAREAAPGKLQQGSRRE